MLLHISRQTAFARHGKARRHLHRSGTMLQEIHGIAAGKDAARRNQRNVELFLQHVLANLGHDRGQIILRPVESESQMPPGQWAFDDNIVGQAVGARWREGVRQSVRISFQWGIGGAVALSAIFALAGPAIIDLMTTAPEVRETARHFLWWLVAAVVVGSAIGLYYYLRVAVSLYLSAPQQLNRDAPSNWQYSAGGIVVLISALLVLVLGIYPQPLISIVQLAAPLM